MYRVQNIQTSALPDRETEERATERRSMDILKDNKPCRHNSEVARRKPNTSILGQPNEGIRLNLTNL